MNDTVDYEYSSVAVELIDANPWQPRLEFDDKDLQDLAQSLAQEGVLQPLIVSTNPLNPARLFVIAGERRLRAAKLAGLKKVPVLFKEMHADDQLRVALIENIQRSNLNIVEEGKAYKCLIDQFGYTQEECAKRVGKDRATIANAMRILLLPEEVREDLVHNRLTAGHARALASLGDKKRILQARDWVLKKGLNVRETEALCKRMKAEMTKAPLQLNSDLHYITKTLRSILHTPVNIKGSTQKGKIEIPYFSPEQFEVVLSLLGYDSTS